MATMRHDQITDEHPAVREVAKWMASAGGHHTPTTMDLGCALDCIQGLVADGLIEVVER